MSRNVLAMSPMATEEASKEILVDMYFCPTQRMKIVGEGPRVIP